MPSLTEAVVACVFVALVITFWITVCYWLFVGWPGWLLIVKAMFILTSGLIFIATACITKP